MTRTLTLMTALVGLALANGCGGAAEDAPAPGEALSSARAGEVCEAVCQHTTECGDADADFCGAGCGAELVKFRGDLMLAYEECFLALDCASATMQDDCEESFDDVPLRPSHEAYVARCRAQSVECFGEELACLDDSEQLGAYSDAIMAAGTACWDLACGEEIFGCLEGVFGDL